jgi:hypothetical protein
MRETSNLHLAALLAAHLILHMRVGCLTSAPLGHFEGFSERRISGSS